MSEHPRISTPVSSSPGRPTSISRPGWPWVNGRYTSQPSFHPSASAGLQGSSSGTGATFLSPGAPSSTTPQQSSPTPRPNMPTTMSYAGGTTHEEPTRQWNFTGFEWAIRDVHKLRDFVEGVGPTDSEQEGSTPDDFEILKHSPMLGDNKFKLEIAFVSSSNGSKPSTLSLYITSLMMDFADYEMSASMMTAIKCQDDRAGERGARAEWVWEFWQNDWVFRQESEVWECPLPPLSALLENSRIRDTDSFVICVQIHCPVGPFVPQQPSVYYVPKDLLDGLEASLDNPNTGDVKFVCLERLGADSDMSPTTSPSEAATPITLRSSSSTSSHLPFSAQTTARKRIIYAHSDILTRRSEYFATMLSSSFSENPGLTPGERKLYTIVVEEADFETIYWLLKFCYANWLLFKEQDDPRAAVEGVGAGWSAKWLNASGGEWDWKTYQKSGFDEGSISGDARSASGESQLSTADLDGTTSGKSKVFQPGTTPTLALPLSSTPRTSSKAATSASSTVRQPNPLPRRSVPAGAMSLSMSGSSTTSRAKPVLIPVPPNNYPSPAHYTTLSPRSTRPHQTNAVSTADPHPHPTPAPKPASALSMYQIAHRYSMPGLAALALEHMMSTITPQSSFALLLATSVWDELHVLVEDYVVEKWDEVSVSTGFEQCCQEVAAGEWGPDGGKTLMALFRRLRSPNAIVYPRP